MKVHVSRFLAVAATGVWAAGAATLDLSGVWSLAESGSSEKIPMSVPGGVHDALLRAGRIEDPFRGRNELKSQWVAERDWVVSRTLSVDDAVLAAPQAVLRLEDVDTFATVFVNGTEVGRCNDRFQRYDFDIKGFLKRGENELKVVFASAAREIRRRVAASPVKAPIADMGLYPHINYIRKPDCHEGWDWGIAQMNVGLCGRAELITDPFTLDYVTSTQDFNGDFSHCTLTVVAETTWAGGRHESFTNRFDIANPPLWWPNGMGERKFYEYDLKIGGRTFHRRIGLRRIEAVSEDEPDGGRSLFFRVNGRSVFAKGANWIPCSAFENEQTPARYRDLLESAAAANMNMVRLWGGGQFEKDVFYDTCDKLGLMIWHDFMFACETSPGEKYVLDEISAELRHQVRRLRDHASIAMWCGDNECNSAHKWWYRVGDVRDDKWGPLPDGYGDSLASNYMVRVRLSDEIVRVCDPTRRFWPSSPSMGRMADLQQSGDGVQGKGDMHYWQVWHRGENFEKYYDLKVRFCSEFGFQSFPSPEVALTFCERENLNPTDPVFEHHQKNNGGNRRILENIARYFRFPTDVEGVLYLSQVQQALAMKTAVEKWRSIQPYCMGALFWQLNDNWPVASWSSIEYGGKWKHLHYQARRFYAPVAVLVVPTDSSFSADLEVWAVNDTYEPVPARIGLETRDFDGGIVASETFERTLGHGATLLRRAKRAEFGDDETRANRFLSVSLVGDGVDFRNEFFFERYKKCPLAVANVSAEADGFAVRLKTDRPAFFVWANAEGIRGEFSDNSFTLLPDRPVTLTFTPKDASVTPEDFRRALKIRHLGSSSLAPSDCKSVSARLGNLE